MSLDELVAGDRVRVLGGRNFDKFHGGMEGTILENNVDSRNMSIRFDDSPAGEPTVVAYRHLEHAPCRGGYRSGHAPSRPSRDPDNPDPGGAASATSPGGTAGGTAGGAGGWLDEHGGLRSQQVVELQGLQSAPELNGRLGRLRRYDAAAGRWEVEVRGAGPRRLRPENMGPAPPTSVPDGLGVAELKERGNECFKAAQLEQAVAFYTAALALLEESEPRPPEADDPKLVSIIYGNRAQCFINLCREVHGEDAVIGKEARGFAMRANMDSARAIELDPTNGKAYYRRGCAVLGMAPSASRAKEAIGCLEMALSGRASGGKDGIILPNAMRHEVGNLLEYAKRRLDSCVEAALPDVEACRENCRQQ